MSVREMTKTCIVCPMGCELSIQIDESGKFTQVTGHRCRRGEGYAVKEVTDPRRVLTTTVAITGAAHPLLPVRTSEPIPKDLLFAAMQEIRQVVVQAPVQAGDVIVANLLGTGADLVSSRDMEAKSPA